MDDVYTEITIYSACTPPSSGEVCADSDYRRNARYARSCTLYSVFLGSLVFDPNPTPSTYNNPEHHEALEVDGYELPAEICCLLSC